MNRAERRRQKKAGIKVQKEPTLNLKVSDFDHMVSHAEKSAKERATAAAIHEIDRQILEHDEAYSLDIDAMVLWTLHVYLGFGKKRLERFYRDMLKEHIHMREVYEMDDTSDKLNEHADVVEVVYLTIKEKRLMPTHAEVLCKIPSTALCETIYTVNKDRLGDFVRTCTDKEMEGVNAGILCSLGIAAPVVDGEPVGNSVTVERNLYKHLYEDLLNKVMAR